MMDISAVKVKFDNIIGSIKKVLHIQGTLKVDNSKKVEVETVNKIEEQNILNAPVTNNNTVNTVVLVTGKEESNQLLGKIAEQAGVQLPVPSEASGEADLPVTEANSKPKKQLALYLEEHSENPDFLLDRGRLLYFHKERLTIDFSKEELVFLVQSSLKNDFPFWYWSFLYREKYENVVPLLKEVYSTQDIKIRTRTIDVFGRFTDTLEDMVELAQTEKDEALLGYMVVGLYKKGDHVRAQRLIANALSRKLIPELDYRDIESLDANLGKNEKQFLAETIAGGWPTEKVKALNIYSASVSNEDLPFMEGLLEKETYSEATFSVLHCIARIGKTTKGILIEKLLEDARWEERFVQILKTIVAVGDKGALPKLFEWLKDSSSFSWRFSSKLHEWKVSSQIKEAILSLMDADFYEIVVKDIVAVPDGKYKHLYTWRQFHLLKEVKKPEILELIRKETRLANFDEWKSMVPEVTTNVTLQKKDKEEVIALITTQNYLTSMLAFRELWTIIPQSEAISHADKIEVLRNDLNKRLREFAESQGPQEQKELAAHDLDYFLGENKLYNRIYSKRASSKTEEEKESPFEKLMEDIDRFERIEDEYITFALKQKDETTKPLLLSLIGRPYEIIYQSISLEWPDLKREEVETAISEIVENNDNQLLQLTAINSGERMGTYDKVEARTKILRIFLPSRIAFKKHGSSRDAENWLTPHNVYYSAITALARIGNPSDIPFIEESINREIIFDRSFFRFSHIHNTSAVEKLLELFETSKSEKEKESALSALDILDFQWSKEELSIEK